MDDSFSLDLHICRNGFSMVGVAYSHSIFGLITM